MSQQPPAVEDEEQPAVAADRERAYEIGRLMAFSDGVFAIAITLLVLNVPVPNLLPAVALARLPAALLDTGPRLLTFALSFFLVGFYWIRHHQLFRQLVDVSVWLLWLNLVVLFLVCLLPFSSGVVGRYADTVAGAEVYAVNLAAIALSFTALNAYATRSQLVHRPGGAGAGRFSRAFAWPLAVVALVMVLAPINLAVSYVLGATLMIGVGVYTTVPRAVRSAPLAGTGPGRLRFTRAAPNVTLRLHSNPAQLFRARFVGPEPPLTVAGNEVSIEYRRIWGLARSGKTADIALNPAIPWRVEVDAGIASLVADLRGLQVTAVRVNGGAGRLDLRLPRPTAAVPIQVRGGAASITIRRPDGVAVRVDSPDNAASTEFDGRRIGAVASLVALQSPDYDGAADHYDVELHGGVARLSIAKG